MFSLLLLLSLVLSACSRPPIQTGVSSEVTKKGVRLIISSDKTIYRPGDTVYINASVENLTDAPIKYTLWSISAPVIDVYVVSPIYDNSVVLFEKDYQPIPFPAVIATEELQAKQTITRQVVWDQKLIVPSSSTIQIQAPAGSYNINCEFSLGIYSSNQEPIKLATSIDIQLQNAVKMVMPDAAVQIARQVPEVANWYADHLGQKVVKNEDGQYYLNVGGEWEKVASGFNGSGETIQEIQQSYEPFHQVMWVNNVWEVHFVSSFGTIPGEMFVNIEPTTGKVLSFHTGK
ncbi:MAG: hypothetical protein ACM3PY_19435 [Omnitrophica WOR_2 bacterium]